MKKRVVIIIILIVITSLMYVYFKYIYGWMEFRWNTDTAEKYRSEVHIKKEDYTKDSITLVTQLTKTINSHERFLASRAYYGKNVVVIIDSIVYSPDLNKMAILAMAMYPAPQERASDVWHYDGGFYIGIRQQDTIALSDIGGTIYMHESSRQRMSDIIRQHGFRRMADEGNGYYNFNDIRLWNSPIWEKIEMERISRQEFEEMKRTHPENVYEPPR